MAGERGLGGLPDRADEMRAEFDEAAALIHDLALAHFESRFAIHHCLVNHGDMTRRLEATMPIVGHIQIAGVPSRNEPDGEEPNQPFLFEQIDRPGHDGSMGRDDGLRASTVDALTWFDTYRRRSLRGRTMHIGSKRSDIVKAYKRIHHCP